MFINLLIVIILINQCTIDCSFIMVDLHEWLSLSFRYYIHAIILIHSKVINNQLLN